MSSCLYAAELWFNINVYLLSVESHRHRTISPYVFRHLLFTALLSVSLPKTQHLIISKFVILHRPASCLPGELRDTVGWLQHMGELPCTVPRLPCTVPAPEHQCTGLKRRCMMVRHSSCESLFVIIILFFLFFKEWKITAFFFSICIHDFVFSIYG